LNFLTDGHLDRKTQFSMMLRAKYERVYRFAFHLTKDEHAAMELTQETFRAALESWASFDGRCAAATWLHAIAYRKFLDGQRAFAVRDRVHREMAAGLHGDGTDGSSTVVAVDTRLDLQSAVDQLDEPQRTIIVLRYPQGLSVDETAEVTGQPSGTVKWRTQTALKELRRILNAGANE